MKETGIDVVNDNIRLNSKRGFAIIKPSSPGEMTGMLSLNGKTKMGGRSLTFELIGDNPIQHLKATCEKESISMPSFEVLEKAGECAGVASWSAVGGVMIQAPGTYGTRREARKAVAQECLRFLAFQQQGHKQTIRRDQEKDDECRDDESAPASNESPDAGAGIVPLVINLIDSPGHIEFNAEVTAALRVSDGALLVVDALEGMQVQTEEVLKQALREGVRPVLMINKVDRLIIDQQLSPDEIFDRMQRVVDGINDFITTHQRDDFSNQQVGFEDGSVCFGSGYFGWSCSINTFVPIFQTVNTTAAAVRKSLAKPENFTKQVIRPIVRMHRAAGVLPSLKGNTSCSPEENLKKVTDLLSKIPGKASRIRLLGNGEDASTLDLRKLLKKAMMAWVPAADAMVDMVAAHVPSPVEAQRLRAPLLYTGDLVDDPSGLGIVECDPDAPTIVYISKMSPVSLKSKALLAFGRVFSGTVRTGDVVRALRTDGTESEAKIKRIQICGVGGRMFTIPSAEAGQLVALEGLDQALSKAGTLASALDAKPICHMTMAVTPILRHSVRPKDKRNLTKMIAAMRHVVDADATALFFRDPETQQHILAGSGGLHIEVLVSSLLEESGIEVELSEPMITYRETVEAESKHALAKSDNKHNRIYIKASPLDEYVVEAMTNGDMSNLEPKAVGSALASDFGWSNNEASRIWGIGPEPLSHGVGEIDQPTCLLVDSTFGIQIPQDARENIVSAFQQVTRQGVKVHAPMRGVCFDLVDAKFHPDSVHRRPGSVVPAAARAMKGAFLMAQPRLVEPIYYATVSGAAGSLNGVYSILGQRSATIVDTSSTATMDTIQATLPVRCSFGLAGSLRGATKGHAHTYCVYQGMGWVPENEEAEIIRETRKRKGMPEKEPSANDFVDKL